MLSERIRRSLGKVRTPLGLLTFRTASAQDVKLLAMFTVHIITQRITYDIYFIVLPSLSQDILAWDFLSRYHAIIDCTRAQFQLPPLWEPPQNELSIRLMVFEDTDIPPSCSVIAPVFCNFPLDT